MTTAIMAACIFVILFGFCPLRRWSFGAAPFVEGSPARTDAVDVVLVHGTFARNAHWTRPEHPFVRRLEQALGDCNVYRLLWSGDNCQYVRTEAAHFLSDWIKSRPASSRVLLVGHSHGGSIAALAATLCDREVKVATLSTPFITVAGRHPAIMRRESSTSLSETDKSIFAVGLSLYMCATCSWIGLLIFPALLERWAVPGSYANLMTGALIAIPALAMPALSRRIQRSADSAGQSIAFLASINLNRESMMIVRATGDEATGLLALGHFLHWVVIATLQLFAALARGVFRIEDYFLRHKKTVLVFLLLLPLAALMERRLEVASPDGSAAAAMCIVGTVPILLRMRYTSYLLSPAFAIVGAIGSFVAFVPFGADIALRSLVVTLSVESTPPGVFDVTLVPAGTAPLAHSVLYDDPRVPTMVAYFFRGEPHFSEQHPWVWATQNAIKVSGRYF